MDALLAEGNLEAALETFLREFVRMAEEDINAMRSQPAWEARIATVHTITRELRAVVTAPFAPDQAARITVPTIVLTGGDKP